MANLGPPLEIPEICVKTLGSGGQKIRHSRVTRNTELFILGLMKIGKDLDFHNLR